MINGGLNGFKLPIEITNDSDYYCSLDSILNDYYEKIKSSFTLPDFVFKNISTNITLIKNCINSYYNSNFFEAIGFLEELIGKYINEKWFVNDLNQSSAFRGNASKCVVKSDFYEQKYEALYKEMNEAKLYFYKARLSSTPIERDGMLHIPYNKRNIISTQRFSLPGIPCIYLSSTTYGCWVELGTDQINNFQVSAFQLPEDIKVLNLCITEDFINGIISRYNVQNSEENKNILFDELCKTLEIFPLICAISFKVKKAESSLPQSVFRSEYVISQLLMQVINKFEIDSVSYLSKAVSSWDGFPQAINLAIPAIQKKNYKKGLYGDKFWERSHEIQLTDPLSLGDVIFSAESLNLDCYSYRNYWNKFYHDHDAFNNVTLNGKKVKYPDTVFFKMDELLLQNEFYEFGILNL